MWDGRQEIMQWVTDGSSAPAVAPAYSSATAAVASLSVAVSAAEGARRRERARAAEREARGEEALEFLRACRNGRGHYFVIERRVLEAQGRDDFDDYLDDDDGFSDVESGRGPASVAAVREFFQWLPTSTASSTDPKVSHVITSLPRHRRTRRSATSLRHCHVITSLRRTRR